MWDPGSAWNEAIGFLHREIEKRRWRTRRSTRFLGDAQGGQGPVFRHVVVRHAARRGGRRRNRQDADHRTRRKSSSSGLMTTRRHKLRESPDARVQALAVVLRQNGRRRGKKPLLFVMTESTEAADQIAHRLNKRSSLQRPQRQDDQPSHQPQGQTQEASARAHRLLRVRRDREANQRRGPRSAAKALPRARQQREPVPLHRLGADAPGRGTSATSRRSCPLRPLQPKSKILPEQTLGRGLRRMTRPGEECSRGDSHGRRARILPVAVRGRARRRGPPA